MQPLCVSYLGFFVGSALSWNSSTVIERESLVEYINTHVFGDLSKSMGALLYDLGNLYLGTGEDINRNGVVFGRLLPDAQYAIGATVTAASMELVKERLNSFLEKVKSLDGTLYLHK